MSLIIASQMEAAFNARLARHPLAPTVIELGDEDLPWDVAPNADILLARPTPPWRHAKHQNAPPEWPGRLKWVSSASAGVDLYPTWILAAPIVTCGRGVASEEIADYVMAAIYLRTKDLQAVSARAPDQWRYVPLGRMTDVTVGLVGFGAIGQAVARRAIATGARVTAIRRRAHLPESDLDVELLDDLKALVAKADHIVLALPGTDETRNLIEGTVLTQVKPGAHLINVGRGSVLDHEALLGALDGGALSFATLDVTEPEPLPAGHRLWTHPRVLLTPHVSANHTLVRDVYWQKVAINLERFAKGETLGDLVDKASGY